MIRYSATSFFLSDKAANNIMSAIIVAVLLLISSPSCITHDDDDYNPTLYKAFRKALISNQTNLIRLQSHFYPSSGNSRTSASIAINRCHFTVKNISLTETMFQAFEKCSCRTMDNDDLYCFVSSTFYRLSMDASSSSQEMLKQHVSELVSLFETFDYISVAFFDSITFSNLSPKYTSDILLSLFIPELHSMPSYVEVDTTLSLLLSWVSH